MYRFICLYIHTRILLLRLYKGLTAQSPNAEDLQREASSPAVADFLESVEAPRGPGTTGLVILTNIMVP